MGVLKKSSKQLVAKVVNSDEEDSESGEEDEEYGEENPNKQSNYESLENRIIAENQTSKEEIKEENDYLDGIVDEDDKEEDEVDAKNNGLLALKSKA
mmetsp:Transcript_21831/g.20982  ORF Transcript_21831/g.20982 Transcript_21831/m.20982 type:complete len:97 (+) Transcript_21831:3-293(+)